MTPGRTAERSALFATVVALVVLALVAVARAPAALTGPGMAVALWAAAVGLLTALRLRAHRRAAEEQRDLAVTAGDRSALFSSEAGEDPFSAARALRWIERWIAPAFGPLAGAALLVLGLRYGRALREGLVAWPADGVSLGAAGLLATAAAGAAVVARYIAVLSRAPAHAPLRAPASALAVLAALTGLAAATAAAAASGIARALAIGAHVQWIGLAILGVESLLVSVARFYRPAARAGVSGLAARFDSPIGMALADPSRALRPAAESVDYQLGFRASQTWWYQFAVRALLPLAVFQALVLYGLSCVVVLGPEEQGIRERLGRPLPDDAGGRLLSGLHFKAPWPFETVRRFPVQRVQRFDAGFALADDAPPREMLWARPHFASEDRFLTPSRDASGGPGGAAPVNLLSVNLPVLYQVTDLRAWLYGHRNPAALLRELAYRAVTREAAGRELDDILGAGQRAFESALRDRLQRDAHAMNLGVEIRFVGLNGVHPPVPVVAEYEAVSGSIEEREALRLDGLAYAVARVPRADAEAARMLAEAAGESARRSASARAEADSFERRRSAEREAPEVFRGRAYLDALARALRGARLYVVATRADQEIIQFNFEDRTPSSLFDWSPPAPAAGRSTGGGADDPGETR
ncbi:MAG: protease modulator HflK [Kiritimatiellae bacterium]|nr:protease modulator HflK [Kiritimatiellia bacterium]